MSLSDVCPIWLKFDSSNFLQTLNLNYLDIVIYWWNDGEENCFLNLDYVTNVSEK